MAIGSCVPSDLYAYVYNFLLNNGLKKTAKSFKKETGQDYTTPDDLGLVEVFNEYLSRKTENSSANEVAPMKSGKDSKKRKHEEDDDQIVKQKKKKSKKEKLLKDEDVKEKPVAVDSKPEKKKKKKSKIEDDKEVNDKTSAQENTENIEVDTNGNNNISENDKLAKNNYQAKNVPFRRVKEEEVFIPEALRDNRFEAKIGARGDWGEKANRDLLCTQGKSFRHEKTKKKRGSYKGGSINTSVNSIKFDNSD